jgi:nondiscriminating glutamyl-tRNA synthetase
MNNSRIRVRFAPAPTGMMHLGNIRTALINYLFAKQKKGTFILRIEDTDQQRNFDPHAEKIIEDLHWLGLDFDEGPLKGGPYAPYFQSQRTPIYQEKLEELANKNLIYRCFCTKEELDKKQERQQALKLPPRYDRTCLHISKEQIQEYLNSHIPFIWRLQLDHNQVVTITDLAHGHVRFEMKNFSDFALTRQDGSFTFIFANFVDDMVMEISHIFRGEDHLSNTANQAALYHAFHKTLPIFFHMPILCSTDGKKLSKRDFGFSLRDLKHAGFLPEAIINYLAILGGSFEQEIMSQEELVSALDFDNMQTTGQIRYDIEKLRWVNRKWIIKYDPIKLTTACLPFLICAYPQVNSLDSTILTPLIQSIKTDMTILTDCVEALTFYFIKPTLHKTDIDAVIDPAIQEHLCTMIEKQLPDITHPETFVNELKQQTKQFNIPLKELFWFIRLALTGKTHGPAIHELIKALGSRESENRLKTVLELCHRV